MERPENLIAKEKMVDILRDLAILNAGRTTNVAILHKNDLEPMALIARSSPTVIGTTLHCQKNTRTSTLKWKRGLRKKKRK